MLQNTIEEMNNIILQPSGSSIANEHYYDTIENRIDLDLVGRFVSDNDLSNLSEIYQGQACMIWGVTQARAILQNGTELVLVM